MQELIQNLAVKGWTSAGAAHVDALDLAAILLRLSDEQFTAGNSREGIALERAAKVADHWVSPDDHERALVEERESGESSGYDRGWTAGRDDGEEQRDDLEDRIERLEREISDLRGNAPAPKSKPWDRVR